MRKILVVDDEAMQRMLARRILSPHYEVVQAESAAEALRIYASNRPDMILSDVMMPGMSGYEMVQRLRESYPEEHTPVMFVTADESEGGESLGFETGASDYIRKPFKADVLLRRVDNIMRQLEQVQSLKREAESDLMTGLLNKAAASEEAGKICLRERGALLMIDLDSFKLVNDLYGHEMGDRVLVAFSEIIRATVRSGDVVGRMGGDEFMAFCIGVRTQDVLEAKSAFINERITAAARALMGEDMTIPLGASIGAVFVPEEGTEFEELYKKADKALYQVKQNGKHGCAVYRGEQGAREDAAPVADGIAAAREILRERNDKPGALGLGVENFQALYRFLVRFADNYHQRIAFLCLTIREQDTESSPEEECVERFRECMRLTLRKSDVIALQGRNQFLALLPEADGVTGHVAMDRVLARWESQHPEDARRCRVSMEIEDLV